ncbi:MAG: hypothetical protein ONB11_10415 [candidate division KSB1 bacterium]|nr:hypothetical protein [candidate division KSB1 bacterium]
MKPSHFIINKCLIPLFIFSLVTINLLFAQTKNPDISIITDFRTFTHDDAALSAEKNKLNLSLHEIELALQGYLNPYARADIYLAKHGIEGPLEIEEASATFLRGLPLGLNIKVGKYLVDFSKLNLLHPHAYLFVERPLLHRIYFGDDGFNDTGINASLLLPTGSVYSEVSFNVLKGDFVRGHHHEGDEHAHETEAEDDEEQALGYTGRFSNHFQVSDYANLELGVSGATAIYDTHENLRLMLGGFDFKYKWRPNKYRSFTLQAEALFNRRELIPGGHEHQAEPADSLETEIETVNTFGFLAFANYQFRQRWNIGAKAEWLQAPDSQDEKYHAYSVFAGFAPMEETSVIRLLFSREQHPGEDAVHKALIQVLFSLGPHKAHVF